LEEVVVVSPGVADEVAVPAVPAEPGVPGVAHPASITPAATTVNSAGASSLRMFGLLTSGRRTR
jgi:hypothetical protein